jgi:hypothetical protein
MFNLFKNGDGAADKAPISPEAEVVVASTPEPIEREILKDFAKQRDAARKRVADGEAECDRLATIIGEGDKVAQALQVDLAADGAASLAAVVSGGKLDKKMSALVAVELAARAATVRQPHAEAALKEARAAAMRAEEDVVRAVRNLTMVEIGKKVALYRSTFAELCRLNDELIGASFALPPVGQLAQELHNLTTAVEVPGFNLGSGSYSPVMRSIPDERRIAKSNASWSAAKEALIADPDADFMKVVSEPHAPIVSIGSAPPGVIRGINPMAGNVGDGVLVNQFGLPVNQFAA